MITNEKILNGLGSESNDREASRKIQADACNLKTVPTRKTIACRKTFAIRLSCVVALVAFLTPILVRVKEESQVSTGIEGQIKQVVVKYVANEGSIQKAARNYIK